MWPQARAMSSQSHPAGRIIDITFHYLRRDVTAIYHAGGDTQMTAQNNINACAVSFETWLMTLVNGDVYTWNHTLNLTLITAIKG